MPTVTFGGLASGLDSNSIVTQLIALERRPIDKLQTTKQELAARGKKLNTLKTRLDELKSTRNALQTATGIVASKTTTSDATALGATAGAGASLGQYNVQVVALAKAGRVRSDGVMGRDIAGVFGAGTLSVALGSGPAVDVAVESTDTLDSLVGKINASASGVTAGVVFDGAAYRLVLAGNQTGTANALTVSEIGTTTGLGNVGNLAQSASDAEISIDGLTMTRGSNSVADAIPGVTLELKKAGTTTSVDVTRDTAGARERMQKAVDAFNNIQTFLNSESAFAGVQKGAESLAGDSTLRSLQSKLRGATQGALSTGTFRTLSSVGLSISREGTLTFDGSKFESALSRDASAVGQLLNDTSVGLLSRIGGVVEEFVGTTSAAVPERLKSIDTRSRSIDKQVEVLERRVEQREVALRKQFATLERVSSALQTQNAALNAALAGLSR